jgi:hypothetical protein
VIMDKLFAERPGHANALRLVAMLRGRGITAFIPAHSLFEIISAVMCHRRVDGKPLTAVGSRADLLGCEGIIVPDLPGGDMIFVALAIHQEIPIITDDQRMRKKAADARVTAYSVEQYLSR